MSIRIHLPITLLLLMLQNPLLAQPSVWKGGKEKMQGFREKGQEQQHILKQWKDHITQWGTDSNYNDALSVGARLNTNGWSAGVYFLQRKEAGKQVLWQLHFSEIKHEKEAKQQNSGNAFSRLGKNTPYFFGKINNIYTLQLGYGGQQMLLPALLDGNMSVGLRYAIGPALALLKPYYLNLVYVRYQPEETATVQTEKYSTDNAAHFLDPGLVLGAARWSRGLDEMKFIPGLFAELAFVIEPDKPKSFVKAITIGANAAFYTKPLALMADRKAHRAQLSLFIGLAIGKRWK